MQTATILPLTASDQDMRPVVPYLHLRFAELILAVLVALATPALSSAQQDVSAAALIEQFKSSHSFWEQFEVAEKLVKLGDKPSLTKLEPYLTDGDRHVRGNAALVFAALGDDRGFEAILGILTDRSNRPEGQGIPGGAWSLTAQIASDRYYAAHLLGDLKDPRAVPILLPLLKDHDVEMIVPWALGEIGDQSAIPALIQTLNDPSPDMRVLAIDGLEALKAKEALPQLQELLTDHEKIHFDGLGTVAEAAKLAIATLSAMH
jgi:HEAT repeat protein